MRGVAPEMCRRASIRRCSLQRSARACSALALNCVAHLLFFTCALYWSRSATMLHTGFVGSRNALHRFLASLAAIQPHHVSGPVQLARLHVCGDTIWLSGDLRPHDLRCGCVTRISASPCAACTHATNGLQCFSSCYSTIRHLLTLCRALACRLQCMCGNHFGRQGWLPPFLCSKPCDSGAPFGQCGGAYTNSVFLAKAARQFSEYHVIRACARCRCRPFIDV